MINVCLRANAQYDAWLVSLFKSAVSLIRRLNSLFIGI
jgi:hypothetical protein